MFHLCFPDHLLHIFRLMYKCTFSVHSDFVKGVRERDSPRGKHLQNMVKLPNQAEPNLQQLQRNSKQRNSFIKTAILQ